MPWNIKWKTTYVAPFLFGYTFCYQFLIPLQQLLVYHKLCITQFNETYCDILRSSKEQIYEKDQNLIQTETASWEIYIDLSRWLPSIFITLVYGSVSDHVGRKVFMLLPIIGEFISTCIYLYCSYYMSLSVKYLFIGSFLSGIMGNFASIIACTFSYVSDITDKTTRTKQMMILESMLFLSGIFSNFVGGTILQYYGFTTSYILMLVVIIITTIYLIFLEESFKPQSSEDGMSIISHCKQHFKESWNLFLVKSKKYVRPLFYGYLVCCAIMVFAFTAINNITVLYSIQPPFNLSKASTTYVFGVLNVVKFLGTHAINVILIGKYQWIDSYLVILHTVCNTGLGLFIAFAAKPWQLFAALIWGSGVGVGLSAVRAALSKLFSVTEQGKVLSMVAVVEVFIVMITSVVSRAIYKETLSLTPAFMYYVVAAVSIIPIGVIYYTKRFEKRSKYNEISNEE